MRWQSGDCYADNCDNGAYFIRLPCGTLACAARANGWGGLQAQMLHIAQGNALGGAYALIKVSRPEMSCKRGQSSLLGLPSAADIMKRATCFMRGNAPWHCVCVLRARGAWHFCAVGSKMPNVLIAAYVTQGVALGYGQQLGLQPAATFCLFL